LDDFDDFFTRYPQHPYHGQLRLICLLQTAAKHYVDPDHCLEPNQTWGGVNDFDVCGFFEAVPRRQLCPRRRSTVDFGPSKFGRNPDDGEHFKGRRVDVLWRSINMRASETPIESVQRYLRNAPANSSARLWVAKPVIALWPYEDFDRTIWRPPSPSQLSAPTRDEQGRP
jgi:hypothetical protein